MENTTTSAGGLDLLKVAKAQKAILILVLVNLLSVFIVRNGAISLVVGIIGAVLMWRLLVALRMNYKALWIIGFIIPLLNLILLLVLNSKATKALRAGGFKVGLMGANVKDVESQTVSTQSV